MKTNIFLIAVSMCFIRPSFAGAETLSLERLQPDKDFDSGCSCIVTNAKDEFLIVSELQENGPAIVRLKGQRKELKWISSTEKKERPKLGDTFYRVYGDGNIKLRLDYKTTFVCAEKDESCEVTRYTVDVTLDDGKTKSELKNLKGDCGC